MADFGDSLDDLGLPQSYTKAAPNARAAMRKQSLSRWFDPDQPEMLLVEVEDYLKAHRLWVEYYLKPENPQTYFLPDSRIKYRMLRNSMLPPLSAGQPSKSIQHAPRRHGKTVTLVWERSSLIAAARPHTIIVVTQVNGQRTKEEVGRIGKTFIKNKRVLADFGKVYPQRRRRAEDRHVKWTNDQLDFVHNGSVIYGVSTNMAHRGRGPHLWEVDDPEPDEESRNENWRAKYFDWFFGAGLGMMTRGSHVDWTGTFQHENCCLQMALRGLSEVASDDGDQMILAPDERFDDFRKESIPMTWEDENGVTQSAWPERMSPEDYSALEKGLGKHIAAREYGGRIIGEGRFVFARDDYRHGYIHCTDTPSEPGSNQWMLDLKTGECVEWKRFLESLFIVAACDPANSTKPTADPGALIIVGVREGGIRYVLDAIVRREIATYWVSEGLPIATAWRCSKMGFEKVQMSNLARDARIKEDIMRGQGLDPPHCVPIEHAGSGMKDRKTRAIIGTLSPLYREDLIRHPQFDNVTDKEGKVWYPLANPHRRYFGELRKQVDGFTDSGATGFDDAADALEMAVALAGDVTGIAVQDEPHNDRIVRLMADAGMVIHRLDLPFSCWTEKMWKEHYAAMYPAVEDERERAEEFDPYADMAYV